MGILYPCLIVYPLCVPVLVFPNGLLVVPRVRYLERGTLLLAAEDAMQDLAVDLRNEDK